MKPFKRLRLKCTLLILLVLGSSRVVCLHGGRRHLFLPTSRQEEAFFFLPECTGRLFPPPQSLQLKKKSLFSQCIPADTLQKRFSIGPAEQICVTVSV